MRLLKSYFTITLCFCTLLLLAGPAQATVLQLEATTTPNASKLMLGKIEIFFVQDAAVEMGAELFKGPLSEDVKAKYLPNGKAPASINMLVLKINNEIILVDTGMGSPENPKSLMLEALPLLGIEPADVDLIILTHMHYDHIGGLLKDGKAVFSKAKIKVSHQESIFWLDPKLVENEKLKKNAEAAQAVSRVYEGRFANFEFNDEVAPGVFAINAAGHTPGHTAYLVQSDKSSLLIAGDFLHAAALQFPYPAEYAVYDMDPSQAVLKRQALLEQAATEKMPIAGMHVPYPGVGYVEKLDNGGFKFIPLEMKK